MTTPNLAIEAEYDQFADVLYLTVGQSDPDAYEEDDDGLVWRLDAQGVRYGVTIMDYHGYWTRRLGFLMDRISESMHIEAPFVRQALATRSCADASTPPT